MPFWKKSEDPWDRKPTSVSYTTFDEPSKEEEKGFLESIREEVADWQEKRKAAAEAEENAPPETCPWCGQEMVKNYLTGGRYGVVLSEEKPGAFMGTTFMDTTLITNEGVLGAYKSCWYCAGCRKLIVDVPEPSSGPNYVWDGGTIKLPDEEEEASHDL